MGESLVGPMPEAILCARGELATDVLREFALLADCDPARDEALLCTGI